jgi:hypothetical protein
MDKYNQISNFIKNKLDDQPIPSIYEDVKQDVKKQLENFETEFKEKCLKLQEETMNKLISGELEYQIDSNPDVENFPIVHLKVDKISSENLQIYNINGQDLECYVNGHKKQNYPNEKNKKLCQDEYVIYINMKNKSSLQSYVKYAIYITNYGRIIISSHYTEYHQCNTTNNKSIPIYENGKINYYSGYSNHSSTLCLTDYTPLEYRMPRLFLKILEAYNKENTDLLQECCKDYFIKHMKSKKKDDELKSKDEIIQHQTKIIIDKDLEIEKLKKEIQEIKKNYINS